MLKELKNNKIYYLLIFIIFSIGFVIRVVKTPELLNFHYDQGRDALVIWELVHNNKFFLIGPTTGLEGVFRGPFYYYLITPFYILGKGNPVWPAVFLEVVAFIGIALMSYIGTLIGGKRTGLVTAIFGMFSYEVFYASRWLSNPTPMLLLSMIIVWCLLKIIDSNKSIFWVILSFVLGLSFFHFGSSGELFYFPAVVIFALYFRKFPNIKALILSIFTFFSTMLPLVLFNLKHDGILIKNLTNLTSTEKTFGLPSWQFLLDRLDLVLVYFSSTIFHSPHAKETIFLITFFVIFVSQFSDLVKSNRFKVVLILILSPLIGLLFFQGNHGNLYQYYLTGYYLIFLLGLSYFVSVVFTKSTFLKVLALYFVIFFVSQNFFWIKSYLNTSANNPSVISLSTQKQAIDWIYKDANGADFNVDVYVPPVIPFSYDYLFKWLGTTYYQKLPVESRVNLLYTIYESDPPHPERLKAWLDRQIGIGNISKEISFGGITVQRRVRINK